MAYENLYTRIEPELRQRLEEHCRRKKTSIQATVTEALKKYLDEIEAASTEIN